MEAEKAENRVNHNGRSMRNAGRWEPLAATGQGRPRVDVGRSVLPNSLSVSGSLPWCDRAWSPPRRSLAEALTGYLALAKCAKAVAGNLPLNEGSMVAVWGASAETTYPTDSRLALARRTEAAVLAPAGVGCAILRCRCPSRR